ncbi:basic amino acid/polyamine antiporter [Lactovum miscens]|uniref:Arginine:ornithine antiporter/lysine permease n=1 Tax=Lactovum miscens TaxID=190387 RepID=A0A841C8R3_9LACT|nr:basic amino acid/polyamine antiporter [Lactovum miscens]MBB5887972.1 arginine:ornithine antiporter/lysine permease [Lactovum miscens]
MQKKQKGIGLFALIAVIVSSAIGGGVFNLTNSLAIEATPGGVVISWFFVGVGIVALVLCLNYLVLKMPELSGLSDYARAGFGDFVGFLSGWGYYLSSWFGNIAFAVLLMQTMAYFIPSFQTAKGSLTLISIVVVSIISLGMTIIVVYGVESAAFINAVILVAKLVPLGFFTIVAVLSFKAGLFTAHFWGNVVKNAQGLLFVSDKLSATDLLGQVKSSLMVMVFLFVGVEGAAMMSNRAKKKDDAGRASVLGVIILLAIYIILSLLPFGYLNQSALAKLQTPGLVYIMKQMVGTWGSAVMAVGLIISIMGAWLAWTMLPVEATSQMAEQRLLPNWFDKRNKYNAPSNSLWLTEIIVQIFIVVTYFFTNAYIVFVNLCTAAIMICYALVGLYVIKLGIQKKQAEIGAFGAVALVFQLLALYLSGWEYIWLTTLLYTIGFALYIIARREHKLKIHRNEWLAMFLIALLAILALFGLIGNWINLRSSLGL